MVYKDKSKQREAVREATRRYRLRLKEKKKTDEPLIEGDTNVTR